MVSMCECCGDHRYLHVRTPSFTTRRSSDRAQHVFGHIAVGVERFERDRPPAFAQIVLRRKDGFTRLLDQRVPFAAIGALPLPAIGGGAAIDRKSTRLNSSH